MVIAPNTDTDFIQSSIEKISSDKTSGATLSRLGIPALHLQRTASIRLKNESSKTLNEVVRPRSILSVVELSVDDTKHSMLVD